MKVIMIEKKNIISYFLLGNLFVKKYLFLRNRLIKILSFNEIFNLDHFLILL